MSDLEALEVTVRIEEGKGSIGRRYARGDEMAIPYAITVDFDTINSVPRTVTLRDRDSTTQLRMPVSCLISRVY